MMLNKTYNKKNTQKGFSLLELLLVVGLTSLLTAGAAAMFNDWFKDSVDRRVARQIIKLQLAAEDYAKLNFDDIVSDLATVGSITEIPLADLRDGGFLTDDYNPLTLHKQRLRVVARYAANNTVSGNVVEVITITEGPEDGSEPKLTNERLFYAASSGGNKIGIISDLDINGTCCSGNIQSTSGSWSIPLAPVIAAVPSLNITPEENGGYLAAYARVASNNAISDQYLFRDESVSNPLANTMNTNLDMNNNDIKSANMVVVDSMDVSGNMALNGNESNGASPYVLSVQGDFTSNTMDVRYNGNTNKGNVYVNTNGTGGSDFEAASLNINLDDGTGGSVQTRSLDNANAANIASQTQFANINMEGNNIIVSGDMFANQLDYGDALTVNGQFQAQNAGSFNNVNTDDVFAGSVSVNPTGGDSVTLNASNISVENNLLVNSGGPATNIGNLSGTNSVNIRSMSECSTNGGQCP